MKIVTKVFSVMLITNLELVLSLLQYLDFPFCGPKIPPELRLKKVFFPFYYANISSARKFYISKFMEFDNV